MVFEELVDKKYDWLTANDREIIRKILGSRAAVLKMNSVELAAFLNISRTTLVRLQRKLDIATFAEFRLLLSENNDDKTTPAFDMQDIVNSYHGMIDEQKKHDYRKLCEMLARAGTIYVYGTGNEQKAIAEEFKRIFLIFGKCCVDIFDYGEAAFASKRFAAGDVLLAISMSGETKEAFKVVRCAAEAGIHTVSMTRWQNNSLARMCEESLYVGTRTVHQPKDQPYEMMAAFYMLLDILSVRYVEYIEGIEANES
ncbi:MAG: MurR/RpiR family transcriptional regulator [Clostridiales bacterium]|nr:MurR/RpiR family transcriptional regulator [Clostridiales bacterium]